MAWSKVKWLMSFNEDKCKILFFEKRKTNLLQNRLLLREYWRYKLLCWSTTFTLHILEETTVERDLGKLKRTFFNWKPHAFRALYTVFVRILEFLQQSTHNIGDIASIKSAQKNAKKLVPSIRSLHYTERLAILDMPTRRVRGSY